MKKLVLVMILFTVLFANVHQAESFLKETAKISTEATTAVDTKQVTWFDNVTAIKAADLLPGGTAATKGYYVAGDGGGAFYTDLLPKN